MRSAGAAPHTNRQDRSAAALVAQLFPIEAAQTDIAAYRAQLFGGRGCAGFAPALGGNESSHGRSSTGYQNFFPLLHSIKQ